MTLGALNEQFWRSTVYWGKDNDVLTALQKDAFLAFLDTLPFDVFLTNPIWADEP